MTTLEIKRLDSISSSSPQYRKRSSLSPLPPQAKAQTSPSSPISPISTNRNSINVNASSSEIPIPIRIVKSPSYTTQQLLNTNEKKSPNSHLFVASSKSNINNDHTALSSNSSSISNLNGNLSNFGDVNNTSSEMNGALITFNKYGFAQPLTSNNNSISINTSTNESSSDVAVAKRRISQNENNLSNNNTSNNSSTLNRIKSPILNQSNSNSNNNNNRSSTQSMAIKNLKDYLQNTDVEEFAENLPIKVIQSREVKWMEMLERFDEWMRRRYPKILSRTRKGIPQSMRAKAWLCLTGALVLKQKAPTRYIECLQNKQNVDITRCIEDIKKDLHRQFPSHELFMKREGRLMLFNVLKAYAAHNPEVGYCQAQGPIAALLLMHMPEEDAFWLLVRISDFYLKEYFKPGLEKVQIDGHALYYLFKRENRTAYKLMESQGIDPVLYMTEWFMCVFARTLPWCTVLRVWDMFFCEGIKVLYRVGLYLLTCAFEDKAKLTRCAQQGMYETLNALKNLPIECLKEETLVAKSNAIKVNEDDLKRAFEKSKAKFIEQNAKLNERRKEKPNFTNNNKQPN